MENNKLDNQNNKENVFLTYKSESAVEVVIKNIKNLLITKNLKPGDKLSSESELCKNMCVSRGSLREAMKILSAYGIIQIRRGDGTYVAKADNKILFDPLLFSLIQSNTGIGELAELRRLIESEIVKLIIKNATDEDIESIKFAYFEMEEAVKNKVNDPKVLSVVDVSFHMALGRVTKNVLVEKIYNFVLDLFTPYIEQTYKSNLENYIISLRLHGNIISTLRDRDLPRAIAAIEESIVEWENSMSKLDPSLDSNIFNKDL